MPKLVFEDVYPKAPFGELVRLAIWLGSRLRGHDDSAPAPKLPANAATHRLS